MRGKKLELLLLFLLRVSCVCVLSQTAVLGSLSSVMTYPDVSAKEVMITFLFVFFFFYSFLYFVIVLLV